MVSPWLVWGSFGLDVVVARRHKSDEITGTKFYAVSRYLYVLVEDATNAKEKSLAR